MATDVARPSYKTVLTTRITLVTSVAQLISLIGTVAAQAALSILVFERTSSPTLSALVLASSFIPQFLAGLTLSSLAYRFEPRRTLVVCDLLGAGVVGCMLVPGLPVWALLLLVCVLGMISPIFFGARTNLLTKRVSDDLFVCARSFVRASSQITVLAGFGVGTLILWAFEPVYALGLDAATFVISAILVAIGIPRGRDDSRAPMSHQSVAAESLRSLKTLIAHSRVTRRLLLASWIPPATVSMTEGLAVAYLGALRTDTRFTVLIYASLAIGMAAGEFLGSSTRRPLNIPSWLLIVVTQLPLCFFLFAPNVWVCSVMLFVSGLGFVYSVALDKEVVGCTPKASRARFYTVQGSGTMVAQGLGIAAGGVAAAWIPISLLITAAGALGVLFAFYFRATASKDAAMEDA